MTQTISERKLQMLPGELEIVCAILRRHVPDRAVWAFGSRVKGTARPCSDLDLTILGDESLPLSTQAELAEEFAESDLPYKVDIGDWATTSERFREIIRAAYIPLPLA
jgi:predicted nucleotidyltransferase